MKTILISGGGGYLGTYLTQVLLKNYKVIVYDEFYFKWLFKNKKKILFNKRLKFIKKDILSVSLNDFEGVDIICDLNGIPNDPSSELNKKHTWNVNYKGRKKFAEIAKSCGIKRYIFNSTCAVYGYNKKVVNEKSKTNPLSTYAKANLKAEKEIVKISELEHVGSQYFAVNINRFRVVEFTAPKALSRNDLKITVDEEDDYLMMSKLYNELYSGLPICLTEAMEWLNLNPSVASINSNVRISKINEEISNSTEGSYVNFCGRVNW